MLSMIDEIMRDVAAVTETQVQLATRALDPVKEHERALGVLHDPQLRRLWALARIYGQRAHVAAAQMDGLEEPETLRRFKVEAARSRDLADSCRELFWAQAKEDIGDTAWEADNIGVREGFMLVSGTRSAPDVRALGMLKDLLGGGQ